MCVIWSLCSKRQVNCLGSYRSFLPYISVYSARPSPARFIPVVARREGANATAPTQNPKFSQKHERLRSCTEPTPKPLTVATARRKENNSAPCANRKPLRIGYIRRRYPANLRAIMIATRSPSPLIQAAALA
jgi:hypothetical protein